KSAPFTYVAALQTAPDPLLPASSGARNCWLAAQAGLAPATGGHVAAPNQSSSGLRRPFQLHPISLLWLRCQGLAHEQRVQPIGIVAAQRAHNRVSQPMIEMNCRQIVHRG